MPEYTLEEIEEAKVLILQDYSVRKVGKALDIPFGTIQIWKKKYKWEKLKPEYPTNSLKAQLERVTKLVDTLEPEIEKVNILDPTKRDKDILANFKRFSELQLKLIRQLGAIDPSVKNPTKNSIFD